MFTPAANSKISMTSTVPTIESQLTSPNLGDPEPSGGQPAPREIFSSCWAKRRSIRASRPSMWLSQSVSPCLWPGGGVGAGEVVT